MIGTTFVRSRLTTTVVLATLYVAVSGMATAEPDPALELQPELEQVLPHQTFVDGLTSFGADFEQRVINENGILIEVSSGKVALHEPNQFRWHYEEPFEQLIVADGQSVWSYDVELEQVSVKSQTEAEAQSPLTLLTDPEELAAQYELTVEDATATVRLTPKAGEGELKFVDLGFVDNMLATLVIEDGFGQRTEITFHEAVRNAALSSALFAFVPPPGIDIIGELPTTQPYAIPEPE